MDGGGTVLGTGVDRPHMITQRTERPVTHRRRHGVHRPGVSGVPIWVAVPACRSSVALIVWC